MKIISAEVVDPRINGVIERPYVLVNVENMTEPTTEQVTHRTPGIVWQTQRYGAFTRCVILSLGKPFSVGLFNKTFSGTYDPMIQVEVFDQASEKDIRGNWLLPLRRSRQMIRKFEPHWRLLMNDRDGQDGLVTWTPARIRGQVCCHYSGLCLNDAVGSVLIDRVEMPYCQTHLEDHNRGQARARSQNSKA